MCRIPFSRICGVLALVYCGTIFLTGCPPTMLARIEATPRSGPAPLEVQFTDRSAGPVTQRELDFADGSELSHQADPVHVFEEAGQYEVRLRVTDINGVTGEDWVLIRVGDPVAPTADFEPSATYGGVPLEVTFTDRSEAGSSEIADYKWDFGDGDIDTETMGDVTHTYNQPGTFVVRLTVTDAEGMVDTMSVEIVVDGKMASVPATTFYMGVPAPYAMPQHFPEEEYPGLYQPESEDAYADEYAPRWVRLEPHMIGTHEITNAEYADMLNACLDQQIVRIDPSLDILTEDGAYPLLRLGPEACLLEVNGGAIRPKEGKDEFPVVSVTWYGAALYCNWRSQQLGFPVSYDSSFRLKALHGGGFRLPTEAEWECAAGWDRSRTDLFDDHLENTGWAWLFPISDDNLAENQANISGNGLMETGAYPDSRSPTGCFDMAGNAAEWCQDDYLERYAADAVDNPCVSASEQGLKAIRGGSFDHFYPAEGIEAARTSKRASLSPGNSRGDLGFRIVRAG